MSNLGINISNKYVSTIYFEKEVGMANSSNGCINSFYKNKKVLATVVVTQRAIIQLVAIYQIVYQHTHTHPTTNSQ